MNHVPILILQAVIYGLLGSTNLLFTRQRLKYVFGEDYQVTSLDVFWQRDIGIFQLGMASLSLYAVLAPSADINMALFVLGLVWSGGAIFLATTALFNLNLRHITSKTAGLAISAISAALAALNWYFFFSS